MALSGEALLPARRLHIPGGLRAVDNRSDSISLQVSSDMQIASFSAPNYADLYRVLQRWHLTTIGVEFLSPETDKGLRAPDWSFASPTGFRLKNECRAWNAIRYAAQRDGAEQLAYDASRYTTLMGLLELRLYQLSLAYNNMLRIWYAEKTTPNDNLLISNTYLPHIDAAIHGFLGDAAVFRDLLSEVVWRHILGSPVKPTTTFGTFLKTARDLEHPLAIEMIAAGAEGGWVKILSGLRDRVVHIAPIGSDHLDHSCRIKLLHVGGISLLALHYPMCSTEGLPPAVDEPFCDDDVKYLAGLQRYAEFHKNSVDGLDYCWTTLNQFLDLGARVRAAAKFREETASIGPADIINFSLTSHP